MAGAKSQREQGEREEKGTHFCLTLLHAEQAALLLVFFSFADFPPPLLPPAPPAPFPPPTGCPLAFLFVPLFVPVPFPVPDPFPVSAVPAIGAGWEEAPLAAAPTVAAWFMGAGT